MKIVSLLHEGGTATVFFEDGSSMKVAEIKALSTAGERPLRLALVDLRGNELQLNKDETRDFLAALVHEHEWWDFKEGMRGSDN